jgi:hypothetical protein
MAQQPAVPQKFARYASAYVLFGLYAFLGVLVTLRAHETAVQTCALVGAKPQVAYVVNTWGAFLLFAVYIALVAAMESYLNQAARTGRVLSAGLKLLVIFAVIGALIAILPVMIMGLGGGS